MRCLQLKAYLLLCMLNLQITLESTACLHTPHLPRSQHIEVNLEVLWEKAHPKDLAAWRLREKLQEKGFLNTSLNLNSNKPWSSNLKLVNYLGSLLENNSDLRLEVIILLWDKNLDILLVNLLQDSSTPQSLVSINLLLDISTQQYQDILFTNLCPSELLYITLLILCSCLLKSQEQLLLRICFVKQPQKIV
jgi:hypothetical protein